MAGNTAELEIEAEVEKWLEDIGEGKPKIANLLVPTLESVTSCANHHRPRIVSVEDQKVPESASLTNTQALAYGQQVVLFADSYRQPC